MTNLGTMEAVSGSGLSLNSVINQGTWLALGGALSLGGSWSNASVLTLSNSVLNLNSAFTLATLGTLVQTGAVVNVAGTLNNTNTTLVVDGLKGTWNLAGGTIQGGAIAGTNGGSWTVTANSTLDGVTLDADTTLLAISHGCNANMSLTVVDGLTLNGTLTLLRPGQVYSGVQLNFSGSQTLLGSGQVVFADQGPPWCGQEAEYVQATSGTLTIGPGITIHGSKGTVGNGPLPLVNEGTILSDGGQTIAVQGNSVTNLGTMEAIGGSLAIYNLADAAGLMVSGGTLGLDGNWANIGLLTATNATVNLGGNWTNAGTLNLGNSTLNLNSAFTLATLGTVIQTGAVVNVTGTLNNTNTTVWADGLKGTWNLAGGTIQGGTIAGTNGGSWTVTANSTLDGVTLDADTTLLAISHGCNANMSLTVVNGLTLNSTLTLLRPGQVYSGVQLNFSGSQTLLGSGQVVFADQGPPWCGKEAEYVQATSGTLTIGPGITIHGGKGTVGNASLPLVNYGTMLSDGGQTITVSAQPFINQSDIRVSTEATLSVNMSATFDDPAALSIQAGGTLQVGGDLLGNTRNVDQWLPQGTLAFTSGAHQMEAMSFDFGNVPDGYVHNFAYGTISLASGAQVTLVDQSTNSAEPPHESVYTTSLIVPSGSTLNLNGLQLYAALTQIGGTVTGGAVSQIPANGGPLTLGISAPGSLSAAGALEGFTFLGRSGEHVAITVDTGSASVLPQPLSYAFVQLLDPSTNLLAQASNTVPRQIIGLLNLILPVDGPYTVAVRAPGNYSASTGNYLVTVWDATPTVAALVVNQQEYGQITSPFAVDEWNFSAVANEQVQFNLINLSSPDVAFNLSGPNGWVGFLNRADKLRLGDSASLRQLHAHRIWNGGVYGIAYSFELAQTAETNLAVGAAFSGSFAGSGQAQLFAITVTNGFPLQILLNNSGAGNGTELYVKLGSPPTRGIYDFSSTLSGSSSQQVLVPNAVPGTYYVLVYGNNIVTAGGYTLSTVPAEILLSSVYPSRLGNQANATLMLTGAGFEPGTAVSLVGANGTKYPASSLALNSFTSLSASFASNAVPVGDYSVLVTGPGGSTNELTNAFQFTAGGQAKLVTASHRPWLPRAARPRNHLRPIRQRRAGHHARPTACRHRAVASHPGTRRRAHAGTTAGRFLEFHGAAALDNHAPVPGQRPDPGSSSAGRVEPGRNRVWRPPTTVEFLDQTPRRLTSGFSPSRTRPRLVGVRSSRRCSRRRWPATPGMPYGKTSPTKPAQPGAATSRRSTTTPLISAHSA